MSLDHATKNRSPEVVNYKARFFRGSGADGAHRSNVRYEYGCAYQMPLHGCPKTNKRRCGE